MCKNNVEDEGGEVSQEKDDVENSVTGNMGDKNEKEPENYDKEHCVETRSEAISQEILTPDEIPVYCTAIIENCPDPELDEDYYQSIRRFLVSEQHLEQNVSRAELQYISSGSSRNKRVHPHCVYCGVCEDS